MTVEKRPGTITAEAEPDLTQRLARWVARGLLTREQADRILAAEPPPVAPASRPVHRPRPGSLVTEALGYVGGVLVLAAVVTIAGRYWSGLGVAGRLWVAFGAAAVLLAAGAVVPVTRGDAAGRLRSVTWLLSTVATAAGLALLGDEVLRLRGENVTLLAAGGAAVLAAGLWWRHRWLLQHGAVVATLAVMVGALAAHLPMDSEYVSGVAVWGVGAVWLLLGWGGIVAARVPAYAFGAVAAVVGAQLAITEWWGAVLALVTVAAVVAAGAVLRDLVLLAVGAVAALSTVTSVLAEHFPDTLAAPLVLLLAGVLLVAVALVIARRWAHPDRPAREPAPHTGSPALAIGIAAAVALLVTGVVLVLGLA
jgi:Predicted membrane protein (DUF2157)